MLGFQTFARLHDIPVVRSSTDKIQDVYSKVKDTSAIIRVPCNLVETVADKSLTFALSIANPIVKPLSGHVRVIDDYAAEKLHQIEIKYPVINTSMEDVVNSLSEKTEPVRHVMSSVKDTTTSTIQHGKETVSNVAAATVNKASGVAESVFSFCGSHVPGIQRLHSNKTQRLSEYLLTSAGSLFNSIFQSARTTFIWFRMFLIFSLFKTKQINDMTLNKIQRKPMLRQHLQRVLITIGTLLEYLIEHIRPDDRTLDELKTKQQSRLKPQPYYYTNRGNYKAEPSLTTYQSVYNGATRSKIDSTILSNKDRLYAPLSNGDLTQSFNVVDSTTFSTNSNDDSTNLHSEIRSTDHANHHFRLTDDFVENVDNNEPISTDGQLLHGHVESNFGQSDLIQPNDEDDE